MEMDYLVHIPDRMYFKIGEAASIVGVKPHVLRYWEFEFSFLSPQKTNSQQRLYSRKDVENALLIKHLLYDERFSIEGAKKQLAQIRKKGTLAEARKPKLGLDVEQVENIKLAKQKLKQLINFCK